MNRRRFMQIAGALAGGASADGFATARARRSIKTFVLVELSGGNDGLNTVIPLNDDRYRALRPTLAIPREHVLHLDEQTGLHPSLLALMPAWEARELAIVQGVGYASSSRSHFRSREIWDTASSAAQYRRDGWLARSDATRASVVGTAEAGPFANASRAVEWIGQARASFAASCDAASRFIVGRAERDKVALVRLTLPGFDTHEHQAAKHARVLAQLADGLASLRRALIASGDWRSTLVMSHSEFGRSARENDARGTDHGAAAPQFVLGGSVSGGLYGAAPRLDDLDVDGGVSVGIDFRRVYATVLSACAELESVASLGPSSDALPLIRA
ncbi:DUF1501 domain-containing protein [Caballeronia sp. LZ001]|uniref:DUF1501 domain-containing protein n=1 Tax=Caballeronia sp. LZ001 TaxID=3038553 RepID=UPI00285548C4|nr:DUF1501 domain-containing protein [Caballeronia sp. LZ001]MDR5805181.1 DUF1501 domain-containing protein [Caballeronia sp. LZ001]